MFYLLSSTFCFNIRLVSFALTHHLSTPPTPTHSSYVYRILHKPCVGRIDTHFVKVVKAAKDPRRCRCHATNCPAPRRTSSIRTIGAATTNTIATNIWRRHIANISVDTPISECNTAKEGERMSSRAPHQNLVFWQLIFYVVGMHFFLNKYLYSLSRLWTRPGCCFVSECCITLNTRLLEIWCNRSAMVFQSGKYLYENLIYFAFGVFSLNLFYKCIQNIRPSHLFHTLWNLYLNFDYKLLITFISIIYFCSSCSFAWSFIRNVLPFAFAFPLNKLLLCFDFEASETIL